MPDRIQVFVNRDIRLDSRPEVLNPVPDRSLYVQNALGQNCPLQRDTEAGQPMANSASVPLAGLLSCAAHAAAEADFHGILSSEERH
jgi:hypothetical protein